MHLHLGVSEVQQFFVVRDFEIYILKLFNTKKLGLNYEVLRSNIAKNYSFCKLYYGK